MSVLRTDVRFPDGQVRQQMSGEYTQDGGEQVSEDKGCKPCVDVSEEYTFRSLPQR